MDLTKLGVFCSEQGTAVPDERVLEVLATR